MTPMQKLPKVPAWLPIVGYGLTLYFSGAFIHAINPFSSQIDEEVVFIGAVAVSCLTLSTVLQLLLLLQVAETPFFAQFLATFTYGLVLLPTIATVSLNSIFERIVLLVYLISQGELKRLLPQRPLQLPSDHLETAVLLLEAISLIGILLIWVVAVYRWYSYRRRGLSNAHSGTS